MGGIKVNIAKDDSKPKPFTNKPKPTKKKKPTRPKAPARTAMPSTTGSVACEFPKAVNAVNCKSEVAKTLSPSCRAKLVRDCLMLKGIQVGTIKDGLNTDDGLNAPVPVVATGVKEIVFGAASIICTTILYVF